MGEARSACRLRFHKGTTPEERMDFATTDDQRMIRDAVEKLTQRFPRSYWLSKAAKTEGPHELWDALASAGFLGTLVPEAYGGAGLGMLEMETLLEALGERGLPLLFLVVSSVMGTLPLVKQRSEEQKRRF